MKSSFNKVFKIAVLTTDSDLFVRTKQQQLPIVENYVETSGAAFGSATIDIDGLSVVAQYWMLEPEKQWESVRNLYFHGTSGIIVLYNPATNNGIKLLQKQFREFIGVSKGKLVPFLVLGISSDVAKNVLTEKTQDLANDIMRWSGFNITHLVVDSTIDLQSTLSHFISTVHIWRAKAAVSTTLQLYFALDAVSNTKRNISQIVIQLRKLYISHRYALLSDQELEALIKEEAASALFISDTEDIIYSKLS